MHLSFLYGFYREAVFFEVVTACMLNGFAGTFLVKLLCRHNGPHNSFLDTGLSCEYSSYRIISAQAEEKQTLVGSSPYLHYKPMDLFIFTTFNLWTLE